MTETVGAAPRLLDELGPGARLAGLLCLSVPLALVHSLTASLAALGIGLALAATARLEWRRLAARLAVVNGFILFLWVLLPLTYPGLPLFSVGPLAFSESGVIMAARITLKSNGLVLAFLALAGAMPMHELGRGLTSLGTPAALTQVLLLTARYVHVLQAEYGRLRQAARSRAFTPGTDAHTYRTYAYMVGMLLVRSHERAKRVYWAMLCRGFTGVFPDPGGRGWTGKDVVFVAGAAMSGLALAVWDRLLLSPPS